MVRKILEAPGIMRTFAYRRLRPVVHRIRFLHSGLQCIITIRAALLDNTARGREELNRVFERRADPWDYATETYHRCRIHGELEMLDAVRGESRFGKALEVGCAEGIFTQLLAERCDSLIAVDISPVALERARQRCLSDERIRFAEWDLRVDPLTENYDLIVAIHSLEYIRSPFFLRAGRAKLVDALRPGGFLLVGTMKEAQLIENAWWGRYLVRGGGRINAFMAAHPALKVVATAEFDCEGEYISSDVLCQKIQ